MDMNKESIEKIVSLADPRIYNACGEEFTNDPNMRRLEKHIDRPETIDFYSLDGVVQAITTEINRDEIETPLFVCVQSNKRVSVFTTYRKDNMQRDVLYTANAMLPEPFQTWSEHDDCIIQLRSRFVPNDDTSYLLDLLSRISNEDSVSSDDNGVTQKVTASTGVMMKKNENVKGRVVLAPFRTFMEVEQPESEFILRIKQGDTPKIGIIEADGGAWKLAAKHNIADYFRAELADLIAENKVVVAE